MVSAMISGELSEMKAYKKQIKMHRCLALLGWCLLILPSMTYAEKQASVPSAYCTCLTFGSLPSQPFTKEKWASQKDSVCKAYLSKSLNGYDGPELSPEQCAPSQASDQDASSESAKLGASLESASQPKRTVKLGMITSSGTPESTVGGLGQPAKRDETSARYGMGYVLERSRRLIVRPFKPVVMGPANPIMVRRVIKRGVPRIKNCYKRALAQQAQLRGKITFKFVITARGRVEKPEVINSTVESQFLENCVSKQLKRLRFARDKVKGRTVVKSPILFRP